MARRVSGKSVTTKLLYFFIEILSRQYVLAEKGISLDGLKKDTINQFKNWFPPSAWGQNKFAITFSAGDFSVKIGRRIFKGEVSDQIMIAFSDFFSGQYNELFASYEEAKQKSGSEEFLSRPFEGSWRIREASQSRLQKHLGADFIGSQTFVPAGRAFFTSVGRIVTAFEQINSFDPITIRFAKTFANVKDYAYHRYSFLRRSPQRIAERDAVMKDLFGGAIKFENDAEFIESSDGRIVPFSTLSSGQQELLPMWLMLDVLGERGEGRGYPGDLFYIEEPEAHLFPRAQISLLNFLIGDFIAKRDKRSLIITTHSPYILAQINNYLKAGEVGKSKKNAQRVAEVVKRECWLPLKKMRAYAISDGVLKSIISDEGLIDAGYIDDVSSDTGNIFDRLLDIQFSSEASDE